MGNPHTLATTSKLSLVLAEFFSPSPASFIYLLIYDLDDLEGPIISKELIHLDTFSNFQKKTQNLSFKFTIFSHPDFLKNGVQWRNNTDSFQRIYLEMIVNTFIFCINDLDIRLKIE